MKILVLLLLVGCGGSLKLKGDVTVRFEWHGAWKPEVQASLRSYVEGLEPSGYFAPLNVQGVDPHFRVVTGTARVVVHEWAPETTPVVPTGYASAFGMHFDGDITVIHIMPAVTGDSTGGSYTLAHELVEAAADDEIADECQWLGYALLDVAGKPQRVPRYMTQSGCWPN